MMCLVRGLEIDIGRMTVFVEMKAHLVLLDRQGTIGDSLGTQFGSEGVKGKDCLGE